MTDAFSHGCSVSDGRQCRIRSVCVKVCGEKASVEASKKSRNGLYRNVQTFAARFVYRDELPSSGYCGGYGGSMQCMPGVRRKCRKKHLCAFGGLSENTVCIGLQRIGRHRNGAFGKYSFGPAAVSVRSIPVMEYACKPALSAFWSDLDAL